ncbi:MAG: exosortase/archaeosortase family protein [Candidatus Omnitrophota bacterium]
MKLSNVFKSSLLITLLGLIYYPSIGWLVNRWNAPEGYYSHGPLIFLASLFFIWSERRTLSEIKVDPSPRGIYLIAAALLLHIAGFYMNFYFISVFSLIILLFGIIMFSFGMNMFRKMIFPIGYLIFMIPMPLVLVSNIVIRMKLFAAQMATNALNIIGIKAIRDGSIIKMPFSYIEVEAPCSGLRSLIALLALGAAFAYLAKHNLWKKWLLFLFALPIAIAANVMRIVLLGWVSDVYGMKAAQGWIHDFSGFLLFAAAALGLLALNGLLTKENDLIEKKHEG